MAQTEAEIRTQLRELLTPAVGDAMCSPDELRQGGVPAAMTQGLSRASRRMRSAADVDEVVEDYTARIVEVYDKQRELGDDPRKLADAVPRGW